jgi:hypothetical protein
MSPSARRWWIPAWLGGVVIGVANGAAREATYGKRLPELTAHNLSSATGVAALAGYFWVLQRRCPLRTAGDALGVGASWAAMTVGFEFGFGRLVAKQSWPELLADYNVARGRTWPLVLAWIAAGPEVIRRAQR